MFDARRNSSGIKNTTTVISFVSSPAVVSVPRRLKSALFWRRVTE